MANKPKFRAFTVRQKGQDEEGKPKSRWTEIGACWETTNGNLRIELEAFPVNGTIILLPPKDEEAAT